MGAQTNRLVKPKSWLCPHPEKRKFFTARQAKKCACRVAALELEHKHHEIVQRPYRCRCGMWHLTTIKR